MFPGESPCDQDKSLAFVLLQSPQSIFWALLCEARERCVICSMKALIFVKQWAARGDGVGPQQESDACAAWLSGSMELQNFGHPCSLHLQFFFSWMHLTVLESFVHYLHWQIWGRASSTCWQMAGTSVFLNLGSKKKNPMNIVIPLLEISLRFCIFPREHRKERSTNVSLILKQHVYINWLYFWACWVVFLVLHDNGIGWVVKNKSEVRIFGQMKNLRGRTTSESGQEKAGNPGLWPDVPRKS